MIKIIFVIFICSSALSEDKFELKNGDSCNSTFKDSDGICVDAKNCELFKTYRDTLSICAFDKTIPIVCCPKVGVRIGESTKRKSEIGKN